MKTFCAVVLLLCAASAGAQSLRANGKHAQKQVHSVVKKATEKYEQSLAESGAPEAKAGHQGHVSLKKISGKAADRADADRWSASADHRRLSEVGSVSRRHLGEEADKAKAKHAAAVAAAAGFNTAKISHHAVQPSSPHATATATTAPPQGGLPPSWAAQLAEAKIIFDLADKDKTGSVTWPDLAAATIKCLSEHSKHPEHANAEPEGVAEPAAAAAEPAAMPIVPTAEPAAAAPDSTVVSEEAAAAPDSPKKVTPTAVKLATETAKLNQEFAAKQGKDPLAIDSEPIVAAISSTRRQLMDAAGLAEVQAAFVAADKTKNGWVSWADLSAALAPVPVPVPVAEAAAAPVAVATAVPAVPTAPETPAAPAAPAAEVAAATPPTDPEVAAATALAAENSAKAEKDGKDPKAIDSEPVVGAVSSESSN